MREKPGKGIRTTIIVFVVLLVVIGIIAAWRAYGNAPDEVEVSNTPDTSTVQTDNTEGAANDGSQDATNEGAATETVDTTTPPDPATFSSIDIPPLDVTVYYTNNAPGFKYQVLRTSSGTSYVEFLSDDLVGTKCTNDEGAFASIIEEPSGSEAQTLVATTSLDGTTYGLSLASPTCTSNESLLATYQTAFKDGFSSLRVFEE